MADNSNITQAFATTFDPVKKIWSGGPDNIDDNVSFGEYYLNLLKSHPDDTIIQVYTLPI